MNLMQKQRGLSLVEIMVSLVISLFLLGGIVSVYIGNKTSYRFSDAAGRIQENGRFALDAITTDLRLAGFFGCVNFDANPELVQNHLDNGSANFNPARHDFLNRPPVQLNANAGLNNSDDIFILGSKPGQAVLDANVPLPGDGDIRVRGSATFSDNDIVLITNCWTSDIFEVNDAETDAGITTLTHTLGDPANTPGNTAINSGEPCPAGAHCLHGGILPNLENAYLANVASVYTLQSVRYFLAPSTSGSGEPALWRSENGDDQELIEGVERMVALYGIDTDGDGVPNQYQDSSFAGNAANATAVRVMLVVRSEEDGVLEESQTYTLDGAERTEADNRLRQVFTVTVNLRNR